MGGKRKKERDWNMKSEKMHWWDPLLALCIVEHKAYEVLRLCGIRETTKIGDAL